MDGLKFHTAIFPGCRTGGGPASGFRRPSMMALASLFAVCGR